MHGDLCLSDQLALLAPPLPSQNNYVRNMLLAELDFKEGCCCSFCDIIELQGLPYIFVSTLNLGDN